MRKSSITIALSAAALCLFAVAAGRWRGASSGIPRLSTPVAPQTMRPVRLLDGDSLAEAAKLTVENDPFRLSNSAPVVRYDPATEGNAISAPTAAPPLRPSLVLKAIVGGPPWQAMIDGIPGQPSGTLAAPGARFDKLVVRAVTRDSVVVQGPDTTWVLSFRSRS